MSMHGYTPVVMDDLKNQKYSNRRSTKDAHMTATLGPFKMAQAGKVTACNSLSTGLKLVQAYYGWMQLSLSSELVV